MQFDVQFATVVPLAGIFVTYLFYFIDRYWYHRLLVGSVKHAIEIEKKYSKELPELALSDAIGKESPYDPGCVVRCLAKVIFVRHEKFRKTGMLHSVGKIEFFYKSVMAVLLLAAILVGLSAVSPCGKRVRSIRRRHHRQPRGSQVLSTMMKAQCCWRWSINAHSAWGCI